MLFHVSMFLLLVLNVVKYGLCEIWQGTSWMGGIFEWETIAMVYLSPNALGDKLNLGRSPSLLLAPCISSAPSLLLLASLLSLSKWEATSDPEEKTCQNVDNSNLSRSLWSSCCTQMISVWCRNHRPISTYHGRIASSPGSRDDCRGCSGSRMWIPRECCRSTSKRPPPQCRGLPTKHCLGLFSLPPLPHIA